MYLYIFEDGKVFQYEKPPTKADKESISDGLLQVIKFETGRFWDLTEGIPVVSVPMASREVHENVEYTVPA